MQILVINQNIPLIKECLPKIDFQESTKNTSTGKLTPKQFEKLRGYLREKGYNPYAIMFW